MANYNAGKFSAAQEVAIDDLKTLTRLEKLAGNRLYSIQFTIYTHTYRLTIISFEND